MSLGPALGEALAVPLVGLFKADVIMRAPASGSGGGRQRGCHPTMGGFAFSVRFGACARSGDDDQVDRRGLIDAGRRSFGRSQLSTTRTERGLASGSPLLR